MDENDPDLWEDVEYDAQAPDIQAGLLFGEGQSSVGGGRPKGSLNRRTIVKRVAGKRHKVKLDGRMRSSTTLELVLRTVRTRAASGNIAAFDLQEVLKRRFAARPWGTTAVLIVPEKLTSEEFDATFGYPDISEKAHQQMIMERFPYILQHRLRCLAERKLTASLTETARLTLSERANRANKA